MSEQLGSDVVGSADSRVALDPGTGPEVLAGIAQRRPELRVFVAMNPSIYPALVQWLAQLGDPAVTAALAGRAPVRAEVAAVPPSPLAPSVTSAAPAEPARAESGPGMGDGTNPTATDVAPTAAGRTRRRSVVIAVVVVGVLILAGGGFAGYRMLTGGSSTPPTAVACGIQRDEIARIVGASVSEAHLRGVTGNGPYGKTEANCEFIVTGDEAVSVVGFKSIDAVKDAAHRSEIATPPAGAQDVPQWGNGAWVATLPDGGWYACFEARGRVWTTVVGSVAGWVPPATTLTDRDRLLLGQIVSAIIGAPAATT